MPKTIVTKVTLTLKSGQEIEYGVEPGTFNMRETMPVWRIPNGYVRGIPYILITFNKPYGKLKKAARKAN